VLYECESGKVVGVPRRPVPMADNDWTGGGNLNFLFKADKHTVPDLLCLVYTNGSENKPRLS
jgi:hypothetical protein